MRLLGSNSFRPKVQALGDRNQNYLIRLKSRPDSEGWGYISCLLFLNLTTTPALAHKVEIAEDIGGTLHIEPNDTPRAGESSLAWFALTRKGGKVLPLEECNCKLSVYSQTTSSSPILSPALKAVSAEKYQGIPGTEIQFPQPGSYQLQLSGTPKIEGNFKQFELKFEVTVAAGTPRVTTSSENSLSNIQPTKQQVSWQLPVIVLAAILGIGILCGVVWRRRK